MTFVDQKGTCRVSGVRASEGVEGYHDAKLQVFLYEIYRQWIR